MSVNLALTYRGLQALELPDDALATFSGAFREGMATERRARILGDRNEDAPDHWQWGGPHNDRIDVLLAPGHTPFLHVPVIRTGEHTIAFLSDLVPTASHVPFPYILGYDHEDAADAPAMQAREDALLGELGYEGQYEHGAH